MLLKGNPISGLHCRISPLKAKTSLVLAAKLSEAVSQLYPIVLDSVAIYGFKERAVSASKFAHCLNRRGFEVMSSVYEPSQAKLELH